MWVTEKELETEIKNIGDKFRQQRKWEVLATTKVKMSGRKKNANRDTYDSWRSFQKFHFVVVQNKGKEMYICSKFKAQSCFC